jgi:cobalt/nickel transport system permease protein
LDQYADGDSPIHRAPPAFKLIGLVALVAIVALAPPSAALFGACAAALFLVAAASRVPAGFLVRKLLFLEPFVLGVVAMTLFQPHGLHRFALTLTRSTLCLAASVLLAATTPFSDFLSALRRFRLPGLLVTTLGLTYRYLFVLADEALRMRRARAARTFTRGRGSAWRSLSTVAARLFVRVSERADRIHAAMCARGWKA